MGAGQADVDGSPTSSTNGQTAGEASLESDYQARLGMRLRAIRRGQGLRLQDVEERSGGRFKAVVIGSYERGDRAVSAHRLAALARFYGVRLSDLLPDEPEDDADDQPGLAIALEPLLRTKDADLIGLKRLVAYVQRCRGSHDGPTLRLRESDLRMVAISAGLQPESLEDWLRGHELLSG
jgi:transcriptional regulator with XRE-family HTH domain